MPTDDKQDIVDALLELNSYDWLVFTSANGVTAFFDLFFKRFQDLRDIGGARIAAVGPATAAKLRELHLQVDLMPEEATRRKNRRGVRQIRERREPENVPAARRGGEPRIAARRWRNWARSWTTSRSTKPWPKRRISPARARGLLEARRGLDDVHERLDGGAFPRAV